MGLKSHRHEHHLPVVPVLRLLRELLAAGLRKRRSLADPDPRVLVLRTAQPTLKVAQSVITSNLSKQLQKARTA